MTVKLRSPGQIGISISMSDTLRDAIDARAASLGLTRSQYLAQLARQDIANGGPMVINSAAVADVLKDAPSSANAQKTDEVLAAVVKAAAAAAKSEKPAKLYAARKPKSPPNRPKKSPPAAETK